MPSDIIVSAGESMIGFVDEVCKTLEERISTENQQIAETKFNGHNTVHVMGEKEKNEKRKK